MKKVFILIGLVGFSFAGKAQTNADLVKHYEAFYTQMKKQGDLQGCINALTHLDVLAPSQTTKDTLAYYYLSGNQYMQALNVLGVEKDEKASNLAIEVKAVALKSVNRLDMAIEQYEILFKKLPTIYTAYEMADLKTQAQKFNEALLNIEYGLKNAKEDDKIAFFETEQPYEVKAKAAFLYQKALCQYSLNKEDFDTPINTLKEALNLSPNFSIAQTIKQALLQRKAGAPN